MSTASKVPNAWDDDWVEKADTPAAEPGPAPTNKKLSKAEKRARQAEFNRQLWQDADSTTDSYYVQTNDIVPLKTEFKPAMKVLSRKPASNTRTSDITSGIDHLNVDDDEDDEEDGKQKPALTLEERQAKAQKDREEKQRKYEEARQRLFGSDKAAEKKSSGNDTPPRQKDGDSRRQSRKRPTSSAGGKAQQLYDPSYTVKPDSSYVQKNEGLESSGQSTPVEQAPIRMPKGPDDSGRGGFGFVPREKHVNSSTPS